MSGVLLETFLGGIVEIVLFMVLLSKNNNKTNDLIPVIQAAILGSILANLLLCLGFCFFIGGMNREEQVFDEAISEVGSGLMLMAGFGLLIPSAFDTSLRATYASNPEIIALLPDSVRKISRATAIILLVAYLMYASYQFLSAIYNPLIEAFSYVWFQMRTHHGIYDSVLEQDEQKDNDRHKDLVKAKLTLTECILALVIALTCVSLHAVFLGEYFPHIDSNTADLDLQFRKLNQSSKGE